MTKYTLEERELQIKFHRIYIQMMLNKYERIEVDEESNERQVRFAKSASVVFRHMIDHIDEVFGKEEPR